MSKRAYSLAGSNPTGGWAKWDDDPPYVPPDEEWEREVAGPEAARAAQLRQWTQHHADNREWAGPAGR